MGHGGPGSDCEASPGKTLCRKGRRRDVSEGNGFKGLGEWTNEA